MHTTLASSLLLLSTAGTVLAAKCPTVANPTRCNVAPLSNPAPSYRCGVKGSVGQPAVLQKTCTASMQSCAEQCLNQAACVSFAYNTVKPGTCTLYTKAVKSMGLTVNQKSTTSFYNRNCYQSDSCQVRPACADTGFILKRGGFNDSRYAIISEWSGNEIILSGDERPWLYRIDDATSQLIAADSTGEGEPVFDDGSFPLHAYPGTTSSGIFGGVPANTTAQNLTCTFAGSDGLGLSCSTASGYNQFGACDANYYSPDIEIGKAFGSNCAPFTAELVCPLTCTNAFYLQGYGPGADTSTVGSFVRNVASAGGSNGTLQLSNTKTLFKLQGEDGSLVDPSGNVAVQPNFIGGYAALTTVPSNAIPSGYRPIRCSFTKGEFIECIANSGYGFSAVDSSTNNVVLGYDRASTFEKIELKIQCA